MTDVTSPTVLVVEGEEEKRIKKRKTKNLFAKFWRAACTFLRARVYINLHSGVAIYHAAAAGISSTTSQATARCGAARMWAWPLHKPAQGRG